ncbi:dipeptidyl-peptidase 5-like [Glandiceps talaboti]
MAQVAEYGSWKSPITSSMVTHGGVSFSDAMTQIDTAGQEFADIVYWLEARADENGRVVLCSRRLGAEKCESWTPKDFNVRSRAHEYGGGAFFVHGGTVYFCNFADNRLYAQKSPTSDPKPLTPADKGWRYADGQFIGKLERIVCVREDHSGIESGKTKEAVNAIVMIKPETQEQVILASGADFYTSPKVSPDGTTLTWMQWNHPNMPWDLTELWTAKLTSDGVVEGSKKQINIGDVSVIQPRWSPSGDLYYISDSSQWWNLYHMKSDGTHNAIAPQEKEIGGPHWIFGNTAYAFDPQGSGKIAMTYGGTLEIYDMNTQETKKIETGFKSHSGLSYSCDGYVYCIGGSPVQFHCVIRVNVSTGKTDIVKESRPMTVDEGYLSIAEPITFTTAENKTAYAFFYPPKNKDYKAPADTLPPLLVQIHGGPTAACQPDLNLKHQYYTSHGIAVLDVNYRGSTGHGTEYRNELRRNWGVHDIEDSCHGALHMANVAKRVDPNRLAISGGSAGGYTVLACLTFKDVFKAGVSRYGIGELEALAQDTHKFESRYLDSLLGKYPEEKHIYVDRSPINSVEKLTVPVAFFQGEDDKVVLPNQAEMMYNAVKSKGIPTAYVLFPGEGHGFRKAENIQAALDGELYFYSRVFGFQPAETPYKMEIDNLASA